MTRPSLALRPAGSILVLHTTPRSVSATVVTDTGEFVHTHVETVPPAAGGPDGSFDATVLAAALVRAARATIDASNGVRAVALVTAVSALVLWDVEDGRAVAACSGVTGAEAIGGWIDTVDPLRQVGRLLGTLDAWVLWTLTEGSRHATGCAAAMSTGLLEPEAAQWDADACAIARLHPWALPQVAVGVGPLAEAITLRGCPPILASCTEQVAVLLGCGGAAGQHLVTAVTEPSDPGSAGPVVLAWGALAGAPTDTSPTPTPTWHRRVALTSRATRWDVIEGTAGALGEEDIGMALGALVRSSPIAVAGVAVDLDALTAAHVPARAMGETIQAGLAIQVVPVDRRALAWGAVVAAGVAMGRWQDPAMAAGLPSP